jgi:hypothetical protein
MLRLNKVAIISRATAVVIATGFCIGSAFAAKPQMEGALRGLQAAQSELQKVTQNKAGHAAAARKLVADAIAEVQAGIAYGNAHGE